MAKLHGIKQHLQPGQVYRRSEIEHWSNAVDRHLKQLQEDGTLTKLSNGLYYCPERTVFGDAPAEDTRLISAFLKDDRFLIHSPNAYNGLGLGMTQLYNETVVYNHKRHGHFELGGRFFNFRMKPHFPKSLNEAFLLVDLVNNLQYIAEDKTTLLERIKRKVLSMDVSTFMQTVKEYGGLRARKFFAETLKNDMIRYAS